MPDYYHLLLPAEIVYLRAALGWSQRRLGEFLGRDGATVSRWEAGLYEPEEWAAVALYKLWLDVFGRYEGPYSPDSLAGHTRGPFAIGGPEAPVPLQSEDGLQKLGALLLGGGLAYLFLRTLDSDGDDSDGDDPGGDDEFGDDREEV